MSITTQLETRLRLAEMSSCFCSPQRVDSFMNYSYLPPLLRGQTYYKSQKTMVNPYIFVKLVIFVALGVCVSPALAEVAPRQVELPAESLDYNSTDLSFSGGEFDFASEGEELRLARKKSQSSTHRKKRERSSQREKIKLNTKYFKGLFSDTGYALTSPWRWNSSDWATASLVAGTTGVFLMLDDEIKSEFQDSRSSTTDDLSEFFEPFGNGAYSFPALVGFYLYGRFGENEKMERTALLAAESFLVTGLFTTVIKTSTGRHRPSKKNNSSTFDGPSTSNKSFPSGHTSTIFAIATVVANEYEEVPLVTPLSYGIATLAGLSRINDNQHWASDVFFGAALGYFTSKTILRLHSNKKGRHFTIYPRAGYRSGGLVLSSRF